MTYVNMADFGFSEPAEDRSPSKQLIDLLIENPEIADYADPRREFMPEKSWNCFRRDIFEKNPDLVLKLEAAGKDTDAIAEKIRTGFDEIESTGWTRITNDAF